MGETIGKSRVWQMEGQKLYKEGEALVGFGSLETYENTGLSLPDLILCKFS